MQQHQAVPPRQRRSSSGCFRRQLHRHLRPPDGSTYGRVSWSIDVPNGAYSTVQVDFGEELDARSKLRTASSAARAHQNLAVNDECATTGTLHRPAGHTTM
jgi:hypothetical protein